MDQTQNIQPNLEGYMRLKEVLRLIPLSKSAWWDGIKEGRYPKPYKIGIQARAWKVKDIEALMTKFEEVR